MIDIIIFSSSLVEHLVSIRKIFQKLRDANLKIQPEKCSFLRKETSFFGHIITTEEIKPNPDKIKQILSYKIPATRKEIKQFLGMVRFYRKFIKHFAKISRPMTNCLKQNKSQR